MKKEIVAREIRPDEIELGLEIRNGIFSPITVEDWNRYERRTGSVAFLEDEVVGFIPLELREIRLAPGVTITAANEFAVGTKESVRGQGVGSKMLEAAKAFLPGKADALYVYRGGERTAGYRFYERNGHIDLHYIRSFMGNGSIARVDERVLVSHGTEEILQNQPRLLELFEETYGNYGGFPERHADYWRVALEESSYYAAHPTDFYFFSLLEEGELTAYLICGKARDGVGPKEHLSIMEMVATGCDLNRLRVLLETGTDFALKQGLQGLACKCGDQHPIADLLMSLNFEAKPRGVQNMALSFDSKALFDKVWKEKFNLPGVELKIFTPEVDLTLLEAEGEVARSVTIEMKHDTFVKWLMARTDFKARVQEGTITIQNGNQQIIDQIAQAIPYCPWEYHHIDYL